MSINQYSWPITQATIASGASLSDVIAVGRANVIALQMPAGWTAAALTFQASIDGDNFFDLFDQAGNEVNVPTAASRFIGGLDALGFGSFSYFRIRSGTSGVPVNQGAARAIQVVLRNAGNY